MSRNLTKPRRRQGERHETKGLTNKPVALHVLYTYDSTHVCRSINDSKTRNGQIRRLWRT